MRDDIPYNFLDPFNDFERKIFLHWNQIEIPHISRCD